MSHQEHLSTMTLDRLLLESLPAPDRTAAEEHLESCQKCAEAWHELRADADHFAATVLPRTLPKLVGRRRPRSWWVWPTLAVPALAAATALLVMVFPVDPDVRSKGSATFQVFAKRGDAVFKLLPSTRVHPGDRLRFVAESAAAPYLLVVSIDGAGEITIYAPFGKDRSLELNPGRNELPGSIELDDVLGRERLYALFSHAPLTSAQVRRHLSPRGLAVEPAPKQIPGVAQVRRIELHKVAP